MWTAVPSTAQVSSTPCLSKVQLKGAVSGTVGFSVVDLPPTWLQAGQDRVDLTSKGTQSSLPAKRTWAETIVKNWKAS